MELEFSADQEELRLGVRTFLEAECPMTLVRAVVEGKSDYLSLWSQMVELGWPALTIPETYGGLGLGVLEAAVVSEELGRVVAPGPLFPTMTQFIPALLALGDSETKARFHGPVAQGKCTGTLALTEIGASVDPAQVNTTATQDGDEWVLSGKKYAVLGGLDVDEIVVVARVSGTTGDEGVAAFIVPAQTANPVPVVALDATRSMATLDLNGIRVSSDRLLGEPGPESAAALRKVIDESITALAIETVGTSQSIFDLTLNYAKEREQFGVPIGSFQAIKHRFADMLVLLERARATSYFAALTVAEDDHRRPLAVATAKAAAGDCQRKIGREGIQIHGGIGYTWEHNMHIYVRRVLTDAQLLGSADEQRARIADSLFV